MRRLSLVKRHRRYLKYLVGSTYRWIVKMSSECLRWPEPEEVQSSWALSEQECRWALTTGFRRRGRSKFIPSRNQFGSLPKGSNKLFPYESKEVGLLFLVKLECCEVRLGPVVLWTSYKQDHRLGEFLTKILVIDSSGITLIWSRRESRNVILCLMVEHGGGSWGILHRHGEGGRESMGGRGSCCCWRISYRYLCIPTWNSFDTYLVWGWTV